jgi:preprotein translocase subunit SecB
LDSIINFNFFRNHSWYYLSKFLFPYAREAVSDMVTRAGFAPVLLNPINFEALFAQQKMQQTENAGAKPN